MIHVLNLINFFKKCPPVNSYRSSSSTDRRTESAFLNSYTLLLTVYRIFFELSCQTYFWVGIPQQPNTSMLATLQQPNIIIMLATLQQPNTAMLATQRQPNTSMLATEQQTNTSMLATHCNSRTLPW